MSDRIAPSVKCCRTCQESKPISEFWRKHVTPDGFNAECKDCVRRRRGSDPARCAKRTETLRRRRAEEGKAARTCGVCFRVCPVSSFAVVTVRNGVDSICRECRRINMFRVRARRHDSPTIPYPVFALLDRTRMFAGRCWICGAPGPDWDHVKPLAKGGVDCPANVRPICRMCNSRKRDRWHGVRWVLGLAKP